MKETLITFQVAKLAKEKGFDIPTLFFYFENYNAGLDYILVDYIGEGQFGTILHPENHNKEKYYIARYNCCTQSLLQKWLREKHKLHIQITTEAFKNGYNWNVQIVDLDFDNSNTEFWKEFGERTTGDYGDTGEYRTYERALEFGLQLALNLIK